MAPADHRTTGPSGRRHGAPAARRVLGLSSAALLGIAAVLLKFPLDGLTHGDVGYVPFVGAVAATAWYGGFGAGLTVTLVTAAGNAWLFVAPTGSFEIASPSEQVRFVLYVTAGVVTSLLIRSLRERRDRLEEALADQKRLTDERDVLREQDRRAAEFRDAFMDVLSHELRTPLTTIYGSAEVLARERTGLDDAARRELLRDVRDEAERLNLLIEDLLVLSRSERGRIEAAVEPVEPRRVLRRVVAVEATRWPLIRFTTHFDEDLPVVAGEDVYVEQVTRNLLANAAKYGPAGGAVVVSAEQVGDEVLIRVLDEGPGLGSVDMDRLFDLFYRASKTARKASGSGIGLFVCARLVEAMGGRMWAHDRPEGGAEFGFALRIFDEDGRRSESPVRAVDAAPRSVAPPSGASAASAGLGARWPVLRRRPRTEARPSGGPAANDRAGAP
jgi:K+-sensing histidine kinase KdpD